MNNNRKKIIAGNWKMNLTLAEGITLANGIKKCITNETTQTALKNRNTEIIIAPNHLALTEVVKTTNTSSIQVAAQNVYFEPNGAYTGEVSVTMLKDIKVMHSIIGHSERRTLLGESDEQINKKLLCLIKAGMTPIFCIGETLAEREANKWTAVIRKQLELGLKDLAVEDVPKVIIAYEPVWAIGTGVSASPEQAQEVHAFIRKELHLNYGGSVGDETSILYGGSVNAKNATELFCEIDIDGALVGGASLKIDDFYTIIEAMLKQK